MAVRVVSRLPSSVVSVFTDTVVDTAYEYALAWRASLESVRFTAHCGEFEIQIPASETEMFENRGANQYESDLSA
jgi:hypothetical protein